ncbi:hypothetical protein AC629_33360 [Bradyrhizobium sp. NAS80.1]|nr:hypothetical protein AC629_33360 [Bradyrhizobium sp. NAS80.1]
MRLLTVVLPQLQAVIQALCSPVHARDLRPRYQHGGMIHSEYMTFNHGVLGSSPSALTKKSL